MVVPACVQWLQWEAYLQGPAGELRKQVASLWEPLRGVKEPQAQMEHDRALRKSVRSLGAYLRASKETLGSLSYMPLLPGCHEMIMLCQMLPLQCGKTGDGGVSLSSCLTVCARHFVMVMGR